MTADGPLVSVFTAAHEIGPGIGTAYRSLLRQTYPNWEWVIVDDSHDSQTADYVAELADAPATQGRVRLYRQYPPPGSIGATKSAAAGLARGEIVVELDHDDELTPEALEVVAATFVSRSDVDFVYSDSIDWIDTPDGEGRTGLYPPGWGFGLGAYATEVIGGRRVPVTLAPPITWETVRHIVAMPNHLRAWRGDFYRRIGGHDHRLPIGDDYELLVRTFLEGTMARIPRPLYIQHHHGEGMNASRRFNPAIQTTVSEQAARYRHALDRRCLWLGLSPAPSEQSPLTSWKPVLAANLVVDVVAEAAEDVGAQLVSVIIPTYQRPELLERALTSALNQTYGNIEVLVVGDHCPFVDDVIATIGDPRVRHWNLPEHYGDLGAAPRNYALKTMARGTLIAYLDDDNRWKPTHVESLVSLFASQPTVTYAFSSFEIGGETIVCRHPCLGQIDTSALVHRPFLLERFGYWRSVREVGYPHDWELVSRWTGEPWAASLEPTLEYALSPLRPGGPLVEELMRVAELERAAEVHRAAERERVGGETHGPA